MRAFFAWIVPAVATYAAWWVFLGTDDDDQYTLAQVAGLVVVLIAVGVVCGWLARRSELLGVIVSAVVGVGVACWTSWSDDESGTFVVGWIMVVFGVIVGAVAVVTVTAAVRQAREGRGTRR